MLLVRQDCWQEKQGESGQSLHGKQKEVRGDVSSDGPTVKLTEDQFGKVSHDIHFFLPSTSTAFALPLSLTLDAFNVRHGILVCTAK
jgi:hypothetical protein